MSKSKYEFWLSFGSGKEKLRLPVLPSVLHVSNPSNNESIEISKLGEVTIIQDPMAKEFSFSSFFVRGDSPLAEYKGVPYPWDFIKTIERWKASGRPIRFVVTGTPINYPVSIEDFSYREGEKDVGDIDYELVLKDFKFVQSRRLTKEQQKTARPNDKPAPKKTIHTVKKGETLIALARLYYKDSSKWRKIWETNKEAMIKREKRNVKQPGHWIFPGQKLVIPA